uniref:Uncharacterized protein n=1 Tax=viral metagenome TaxID=1070528 RepID=A0A6M3K8J3_9ZZZZ
MATIYNLNKSISDMTLEDVHLLVRSLRESRRVPKPQQKIYSKSTKAKSYKAKKEMSLDQLMNKMSDKMKLELIKKLEES